jgi:chemotaxis protein MotB
MNKIAQLALLLLIFATSCVPGRRFQEVEAEAKKCAEEREILSNQNADLTSALDESKSDYEVLLKGVDKLKSDTTLLGSSLRRMTRQYDKINELNEQLMRKQSDLMSSTESEKKELLNALIGVQSDLQDQEALLGDLERALNEKSNDLKLREERVNELESLLASKDAAVNELKNRVSNALLNFKDKGLTVEERDGRVYVSLEAKLLFASGSTSVSAEGSKALIKLAQAIENQNDIGIMVEGHTDSDKILGNSASYKDNWDLSVLRATSVVRIMQDNSSIDPTILTASGRSEFLPIDPDDKAKNRRIEIILTPDLDELFKLIEN